MILDPVSPHMGHLTSAQAGKVGNPARLPKLVRPRLAQRAQTPGQVGKEYRPSTEVAADERGQAGHVLLAHGVALCPELADGGVRVDRRPQNDAIQDKAERAELGPPGRARTGGKAAPDCRAACAAPGTAAHPPGAVAARHVGQ